MIRFGVSGLPPADGDDGQFLDALVAAGHGAYELAFVNGFPWKEKRCRRFGELAAERNVALSVHAPYFAVLTVDDPDNRKQTLAALEHTMKLGKALGAHTIVAHAGYMKDRTSEQIHELVDDGLRVIEPKVRYLGVALGLETSGTDRAFGTLGDIALIARQFSFVRPVIDWAHVHAKSGGGLTTKEAFQSVIAFLREQFPGWAIDPLHTQFTDNHFGPSGEIKHVPYGDGTLRSAPLAAAATEAGLRMIVISEAKEDESHAGILADLRDGEQAARPAEPSGGRPAGSGLVELPEQVLVTEATDGYPVVGAERPLRLSNVDKVFFAQDGYTKGDLVEYYASIAPLLLPHLAGRALSMARYPDGADGSFFYEKQCPGHAPQWMVRAPLHSEVRGQAIEFCTASDTESLLWLANMGCIEMHPWLSRVTTPDEPDFAVFDLDPAHGATWAQVVDVARHLKVVLDQIGLPSHLKTSGATGLHIYVPIAAGYDYKRVRKLVETAGRLIVGAAPGDATMEWDIPRRSGRVFIDHNQNVGGKTIASVYSVRPRPGAPVSTPILWNELDSVRPDDFTIATIWDRLRQFGDLFAPVLEPGPEIEAAEVALGIG